MNFLIADKLLIHTCPDYVKRLNTLEIETNNFKKIKILKYYKIGEVQKM